MILMSHEFGKYETGLLTWKFAIARRPILVLNRVVDLLWRGGCECPWNRKRHVWKSTTSDFVDRGIDRGATNSSRNGWDDIVYHVTQQPGSGELAIKREDIQC